ncbi:MAG: tetratricopeptide repeat protein [Methanothrix sp.]|uniref:tetratricopeptide repeat protein n=1 Tax=Methanothrix sp. TaxID=90426 RepID=UPI0032B01B82|nr:tetratricopeptide repeat protein [Methanothrix sp.]
MDQLVVLHEIFESFSRGTGALRDIEPRSVEGRCASLVVKLLQSCLDGDIDEEVCRELSECLSNIYELKRLGDICRRAGMPEIAMKCYSKALSQTEEPHVRSVLMNNLGQVHAQKGDLGKAIVYYKKALEGFEYAGDPGSAAHVMGNLASAYRRAYQWDRAVECYFKGLKGFEKLNDSFGVAQMTGSLGRVYAEMGEKELAVLYYEKSLRMFEQLGDRRSAAWLLSRLGRVYAEKGRWDDAKRCFERSLSIFEDLGQSQNAGIVLSNMGRFYLDKEDPDSARDSLERALKILRKEMLPVYPNTVAALAAAYSLLARRYAAEGDVKQSSQLYSRASDCFSELSLHPRILISELRAAAGQARSLSYLVKLRADPREDEAVALCERAISALESTIASTASKEREKVASLVRCLQGIKELWSIDLYAAEPWRILGMVSVACEYLMGGIRELARSPGSYKEMYEALVAINGALDDEKQRRDSSANLRRAAEHLRASQVEGFEKIAETLEMAGRSELVQGMSPSDILNYGAHRKALLSIGWAAAESLLSEIDRTGWIYAWDESMNLSEAGPVGRTERIRRKAESIAEIREVPVVEVGSANLRGSAADVSEERTVGSTSIVPAQTVLVSAAAPSLLARTETIRPEIALEGPYVIESFADYEHDEASYDEPLRSESSDATADAVYSGAAPVAHRSSLRESVAARILLGLIALAGTAYAIMHVILGIL